MPPGIWVCFLTSTLTSRTTSKSLHRGGLCSTEEYRPGEQRPSTEGSGDPGARAHYQQTGLMQFPHDCMVFLHARTISKFQRVQDSEARIVTWSRRYDHITPILRDLHCMSLPVEKRIIFKILMMTYRALHDLSPDYISVLPHVPADSLRSADVPITSRRRTFGDRRFAYAAPSYCGTVCHWQFAMLSQWLTFKSTLKTQLFAKAF